MPCTQAAPLHFTESDNNQPNRKRSHEAAHQLHDTANHETVQSIRANSRYFTNPATLEFFFPNSSLFRPKIHAKPSRQWQLGLNSNPSISIVGGGEYLPPFLADRMDLYAIQGRKSRIIPPVSSAKRRGCMILRLYINMSHSADKCCFSPFLNLLQIIWFDDIIKAKWTMLKI